MLINGQAATGDTGNIIASLQSVGSGFRERTKYTGQYFSRGESEPLRAKLEEMVDNDIKAGKSNPLSYNLRPVVPDAYRVEGGEVGFSAREPIGTDNTHDCVTVMLRDPVTKKTALAHIGGDTTEESLQIMWQEMARPRVERDGSILSRTKRLFSGDFTGAWNGTKPSAPIEMRILGGRQLPIDVAEDDPAYPYQKKNNDIARWNVEKVVRFFQDKHVNVLSADILSPEQPAAVVVDPETFQIVEKVPGKQNPNAFVNGLMVLYTGNFLDEGPAGHNPLMKAFDLTASPERNPVSLTAKQMAQLQTFMTQDRSQIEEHFKKMGRSGFMLDQTLERVEALREAYTQGRVVHRSNATLIDPEISGLGELPPPGINPQLWSQMPRNLPGRRSQGMSRENI